MHFFSFSREKEHYCAKKIDGKSRCFRLLISMILWLWKCDYIAAVLPHRRQRPGAVFCMREQRDAHCGQGPCQIRQQGRVSAKCRENRYCVGQTNWRIVCWKYRKKRWERQRKLRTALYFHCPSVTLLSQRSSLSFSLVCIVVTRISRNGAL